MRRNALETAIGALVLAAAGGFLAFSYQAADIGAVGSGYTVKARFDRVDGLKNGADVRMRKCGQHFVFIPELHWILRTFLRVKPVRVLDEIGVGGRLADRAHVS